MSGSLKVVNECWKVPPVPTMSRDPEAPSMVPSFLKSLSGFRLLEKNHDFCQQLFLPNPVEMASCSYFCGANWSCRPSRESCNKQSWSAGTACCLDLIYADEMGDSFNELIKLVIEWIVGHLSCDSCWWEILFNNILHSSCSLLLGMVVGFYKVIYNDQSFHTKVSPGLIVQSTYNVFSK